MMKGELLVMLLAVAVTSSVASFRDDVPDVSNGGEVADVDVIATDAIDSRRLSVGTIGASDILLYNKTHSEGPAVSGLPVSDIRIRVSAPITAIRVAPVAGAPQNIVSYIFGGGVGRNFVFIRIVRPIGRGYNVLIQIYGKKQSLK